MFDWKNFEIHKQIFSQSSDNSYWEASAQHHVSIRPKDLLRWIEFCKDDLGYVTLVDLAGAHSAHGIELVYLLFNMDNHQRINLHLQIGAGEIVPSIVSHFTHADWPEREQGERFNICFDRQISPLIGLEQSFDLPKLRFNPNKSEAPYPEESYVWKHFDLLNPLTKGQFDWQVCFDPIRVVDSKVRIGQHHRNLESIFEKKNWRHIVELADIINPGASPSYAIAWAKNIEDVLRIKLPERAQAIRIVMLELARIADHLTVLHSISYALKKDEYKIFLNVREKIYELFEKYSGHRLGRGCVQIGGVKEDLPHGWIVEFQEVATILKRNLKIAHSSLLGQRDFRSHLDHSTVNAQTVLQWGVSGPAMRAAGLNFDLRRSQALYFYQDIDFDVPVGIHGTAFDRYLIRYEEIHQSLRIIIQVLDNLPLGEILNSQCSAPDYVSNLLVDHSPRWHYSGLESPNGEAGMFFHHNGGLSPARLKIKSPSFSIAQALGALVQGLEEWQLPGAMASLGLNPQEQDR